MNKVREISEVHKSLIENPKRVRDLKSMRENTHGLGYKRNSAYRLLRETVHPCIALNQSKKEGGRMLQHSPAPLGIVK